MANREKLATTVKKLLRKAKAAKVEDCGVEAAWEVYRGPDPSRRAVWLEKLLSRIQELKRKMPL